MCINAAHHLETPYLSLIGCCRHFVSQVDESYGNSRRLYHPNTWPFIVITTKITTCKWYALINWSKRESRCFVFNAPADYAYVSKNIKRFKTIYTGADPWWGDGGLGGQNHRPPPPPPPHHFWGIPKLRGKKRCVCVREYTAFWYLTVGHPVLSKILCTWIYMYIHTYLRPSTHINIHMHIYTHTCIYM